MSKYIDDNKENITTILHALKEQYSKKFKKKILPAQEPFLIEMAKNIKKIRGDFEWIKNEANEPILNIFKNGKLVISRN